MARPGIFSRAISMRMKRSSSGILRAIGTPGAGVNRSGATSFDVGWHPIALNAITVAKSHDTMLARRTLMAAKFQVVVERVEDLHHPQVMSGWIGHHHAIEH